MRHIQPVLEDLAKIPDGITQILYSDNTAEQDRLNRYLEIYIELLEARK